jgi:hypothetical protein
MRASAVLVLGATALWLPACGGDGGGGIDRSGAQKPTSASAKQRFIERGDAICKGANEKIDALNEGLNAAAGDSPKKQLAAAEPALRSAIDVYDNATQDFKALKPPPDGRRVADTFVSIAEDQRALLGQLAAAAKDRDVAGYGSGARKLEQLAQRRTGLAQGYGFRGAREEVRVVSRRRTFAPRPRRSRPAGRPAGAARCSSGGRTGR